MYGYPPQDTSIAHHGSSSGGQAQGQQQSQDQHNNHDYHTNIFSDSGHYDNSGTVNGTVNAAASTSTSTPVMDHHQHQHSHSHSHSHSQSHSPHLFRQLSNENYHQQHTHSHATTHTTGHDQQNYYPNTYTSTPQYNYAHLTPGSHSAPLLSPHESVHNPFDNTPLSTTPGLPIQDLDGGYSNHSQPHSHSHSQSLDHTPHAHHHTHSHSWDQPLPQHQPEHQQHQHQQHQPQQHDSDLPAWYSDGAARYDDWLNVNSSSHNRHFSFPDSFPPPPPQNHYDHTHQLDSQPHSGANSLSDFISVPPPSAAKGKSRASDWADDYGRELKRFKPDGHDEFEKDVALVKAYLLELIGLLQPFAATPAQPNPTPPPPYLQTRFARLSTSIHSTLLKIAPNAHPNLHPDFVLSLPALPSSSKYPHDPSETSLTSAEKEMEIIRKRRDALIAKANQAKAAQLSSGLTTDGQLEGLKPQEVGAALSLGGMSGLGGTGAEGHLTPLSMSANLQAEVLTGHDLAGTGDVMRPMGRCHGCGVGVTLEWRRGPDGAKTLCDSCGLHYAKLSRKKMSMSDSPRQNHMQPLLG